MQWEPFIITLLHFQNDEVRQYFAEQFKLENYGGTNLVSSRTRLFYVRISKTHRVKTFRTCSPGTT